ncbi:response regulator [Mesorhizobium sp. CN2-181]|uniref:response regulator n=1 Tax=Mesorhizobium yinganensis TaxID=3157707 RepID=UPI0032B84CAE
MTGRTLQDVGILVVEDEYFIAAELERALVAWGARVIGPFSRSEQARVALQQGQSPSAAVLDINIGGTLIYPLAEELRAAGIPVVFTTGYDVSVIPAEFKTIPLLVKPIEFRQLTEILGRTFRGIEVTGTADGNRTSVSAGRGRPGD